MELVFIKNIYFQRSVRLGYMDQFIEIFILDTEITDLTLSSVRMKYFGILKENDMAVANVKGVFRADVQKVWEIVTSLQDYGWRSDISKIEVLDEKRFVEYTRDGYATTFTITACEPCRRWEFDMENSNMKGHWAGIFTAKDGAAEIDFTEDVAAKKMIMKPFVKGYLKKQQEQYVADLRKVLEG